MALQNYPDPQFFVNCAQLRIVGTTTAPIPSGKTVSIPGHVAADDKGLTYNIYESDPLASAYPIPGPKPYFPTTDSPLLDPSSSSESQRTEGLVPKSCILKNGNWCAAEIPDFSDENECWQSSDNCWKQVEACYNAAPPSGNKGCKIWSEKKCEVTQRRCAEGDWNGPKEKGVVVAGWDEVSEPIPGGRGLPGVDVGEGRVEEKGEGGKGAEGSSTKTVAAGVGEESSSTISTVVTSATGATVLTVTTSATEGKGKTGTPSVKTAPSATQTSKSGGGCNGGRRRRVVN